MKVSCEVAVRMCGGYRFLLYTAALSIGIFGAQTQFRFVAFKVKQLLGVERSTTLPVSMKENNEQGL